MSAFRTVCGFYCASVALIGIYFFIILAIMEFRGNTYLMQMVQVVPPENGEKQPQIDARIKGWAFMVTAGVQVIIMFGCYFCAKSSAAGDVQAEKDEMEKQTKAYQSLEQMDPNQIP